MKQKCECGHEINRHSSVGCDVCSCDTPVEAFEIDDLRASLTDAQNLIAAQQERIESLDAQLTEANNKVAQLAHYSVGLDEANAQNEKLLELLEESKINCSIDNHAGGDDYECKFCNKARTLLA